ncbi:MAG: signal peptidase I [Pseudomonadota bacterium]
MDIDFAFWLVVLTAISGVIVLLDYCWLRKRRAEAQAEPVVIEYAKSFFPVLALVLVLRSFLAEPFTIPSGSMLPTLQVGDYIVVNKYAYGLRLPVAGTHLVDIGTPERGDIMVFRFPGNPATSYIKRVIGLPGDRVAWANGVLLLNGEQVPLEQTGREVMLAGGAELTFRQNLGTHSFTIRREEGREAFPGVHEWTVPEGHYFVMGDNRDNSYDSRGWGFVPDELIVGKAVYVWMHKAPGLHLPTFSRNGSVYRTDHADSGNANGE